MAKHKKRRVRQRAKAHKTRVKAGRKRRVRSRRRSPVTKKRVARATRRKR